MSVILSGKEVAEALKESLIKEVSELKGKGYTPCLKIVIVGDRPDSVAYIKGALKRCSEIGIEASVLELPGDISEQEFIKKIHELNNDESVNGMLIMRPLPSQISEDRVKYEISPEKDLDCFSPINVAKVMAGEKEGFPPCTPQAVIEILDHFKIDPAGKKVAVVGRSMVVGRPLAMMLLQRNATVTICHSKTKDLAEETKRAEILIAAVGKAKMVKKDMVGEGAVVIDVGINVDENGKLCGDVDFDDVKDKVAMITPVPGGVGSVTTTVLAKHVIKALKQQKSL
ncbi:methenyl-tetrahydrofolate dehydrogenase [Thermoanaerobacter kivui]|uniref:Bifunctional protein FolD n=1 Tax=Thermoanaerobacter kivui TaxID=2325 RepID=A0A097ATL2_THEKI|nr:tetrahydrofolate dehydrogenase/cyclohydrolase catalytic domain-containing protein [Thermoanaerobacter kivui]AIS53134.1 methenyl-tetrahydrofolate dehydrogenase [Thermoanaerobacter kivui]